MRYGIFSDVHSNLGALTAVLQSYRDEGIDRYLCAGDIVGYAADPAECVSLIINGGILAVAGNHDRACVDLFPLDYFNREARQAIIRTQGYLSRQAREYLVSLELTFQNEDLTLVHGSLDFPQEFNYLFDLRQARKSFSVCMTPVCFVGHTHVPGFFVKDKNGDLHKAGGNSIAVEKGCAYIINVGSVGQPRDGDPRAAYCVYDTTNRIVEIKRVMYDIESARRMIVERGFPSYLGNRLLRGQ